MSKSIRRSKTPLDSGERRHYRVLLYTAPDICPVSGKPTKERWQVTYRVPDADYRGYVHNCRNSETEEWI